MHTDTFAIDETIRSSGQAAFQHLETALALARASRFTATRPLAAAGPARAAARGVVPPLRRQAARIPVVVAHRSPIIAAGLLTTLEKLDTVEATACPQDGEPWLAAVGDRCGHVVFADYDGAVEGARAGRVEGGALAAWVCVTTRHREAEIREALDAGVSGYLLSECPLEDYAACIRSLGEGDPYVCEGARQRLADSERLQALTPRELTVLRLLIDGRSNQNISDELRLALGTVKAHVRTILTKLGARSRTQAASLAAARGIYGVVNGG